MLEISRILTAAGLVAASTGVVIFGIGAAFVEPQDSEMNLGIILMIGGVIAAAIGVFMYRQYSVDE